MIWILLRMQKKSALYGVRSLKETLILQRRSYSRENIIVILMA